MYLYTYRNKNKVHFFITSKLTLDNIIFCIILYIGTIVINIKNDNYIFDDGRRKA